MNPRDAKQWAEPAKTDNGIRSVADGGRAYHPPVTVLPVCSLPLSLSLF